LDYLDAVHNNNTAMGIKRDYETKILYYLLLGTGIGFAIIIMVAISVTQDCGITKGTAPPPPPSKDGKQHKNFYECKRMYVVSKMFVLSHIS
jgi:hypothetical protein